MKVRYFALATFILILIIGIVGCSKHEPKNLRYEIADAANDYFGDGRFQLMQYDPNGEYYLKT